MSEIDRAELRRLLDEATPGPWEFGDRQFRARVHPKMFGEGRCTYCGNPDRPLVHTGRGKNPWHVHEGERPWWDHGVYAYRASGSLVIVNDTDEYGYMADENARLIVAAVNALPGLLDTLEKAEGHRDSLAATLIEVQREKLAAAGDLLPAESVALTVALAQLLRGDEPDPNVASMCILALARIAGRHDWTSGGE